MNEKAKQKNTRKSSKPQNKKSKKPGSFFEQNTKIDYHYVKMHKMDT